MQQPDKPKVLRNKVELLAAWSPVAVLLLRVVQDFGIEGKQVFQNMCVYVCVCLHIHTRVEAFVQPCEQLLIVTVSFHEILWSLAAA